MGTQLLDADDFQPFADVGKAQVQKTFDRDDGLLGQKISKEAICIFPATPPVSMQATDGEWELPYDVKEHFTGQQGGEKMIFAVREEGSKCAVDNNAIQEDEKTDIIIALQNVKIDVSEVMDEANDSFYAEDQLDGDGDVLPIDDTDAANEDTPSMMSTDGNRLLCHPSEESGQVGSNPCCLGTDVHSEQPSSKVGLKTDSDICQPTPDTDHDLQSPQQVKDELEPSVELIANGAFGKAYKVVDEDGTRCIKRLEVYPDDPEKQRAAEAEMSIHPTIDHPNIVEYHYHYEDSAEGDYHMTYNIEMEFMPGGTLAGKLEKRSLSEKEVIAYLRDMLKGLQYLHQRGIVHRDIKPDNMLLNAKQDVLKLADFGTAVQLSDKHDTVTETSFVGTPRYIAREIWRCEPHGTAADIWSVGATLVEMVNGQPPFDEQNIAIQNACALMYKVGDQGIVPLVVRSVSDELHDIIRSCFKQNPEERPTAEMLLNHPIFKTNE